MYYNWCIFSAYNVEHRHNFLWNSIGYLDKEAESVATIRKLLLGSFGYFIIGSLFAAFAFHLYNEPFHPFHDILVTKGKGFQLLLNIW